MLGGYVENDRKRALFHELTELSFEEREARISQAYLEDPLPPDPGRRDRAPHRRRSSSPGPLTRRRC
jgi:hypothetical protein